MKKYIITIVIIILTVVIGFGTYFVYKNVNNKSDSDIIQEKVDQEIKYLDSTIISMLNNFNHISYANYKAVQNEIKLPDNGKEESNSLQSSSGSQSESQSSGSQGRSKVTK